MKDRLVICSKYLEEIESKLSAFLASPESEPEEKTGLTEALTFVQQARKAISEALVRVESLHGRRHVDKKSKEFSRSAASGKV
jgi:hypothetical protein